MKKLLIALIMSIFLISLISAAPSIYLHYPNQTLSYNWFGGSQLFNWTVTGTLDSCWYNYNGINTSINCHGQDNMKVDTLGDTNYQVFDQYQRSQSFNSTFTGNIDKVSLYLKKDGTVTWNDTVSIYASNGSGAVTGSALTSGEINASLLGTDYSWIDIELPNYLLSRGLEYVILVKNQTIDGDGSNRLNWNLSSTSTFSGKAYQTDDNGNTWSLVTGDFLFKVIMENTNYSESYLNLTNYKNLTFYANDTSNNINSSYINWSYIIFQNNESYNLNTLEGSTETFTLNFSILSGYELSSVKLIYNGTAYSSSFTEYATNSYYVSKSITIPEYPTNSNVSFYWSISFDSGSGVSQNTTMHNQTVFTLGIDNCGSYTNNIFNISMFDEESKAFLVGATAGTEIKVTIGLSPLSSTTNLLNYSANYTQINPARICLQYPLNSTTYRVDGVIEYSSTGRFREYYNLQNYTLNEATDNAQIYLYNLNSSKGSEFRITYKDTNFVPISGAILNIQRKYIEDGIYRTTEIPKTGANGDTIGHLVPSDVIYNIIVMKEGQVLAIFTDIVADCQNPLLETCSINLNSLSSSLLPSDFSSVGDITFTLTYNKNRTINSIFTIPSGVTSQVDLNVTLFDSLGNYTVCSDSLFSSGGSLSCDVPLSFGNTTVIAKLYKDGDLTGQAIISLAQKPRDIYGYNIMFIALIAMFTLIGIAISDSPMVFGIMLMLGAFVLIALNIIYTPSLIGVGATVLWFVVAIILVLIKGSNRT